VKTKNLAVSALIGLLTLALWYNFMLKPTKSETTKVKAETADEQSKLQPLQAQLAQAKTDAENAGTVKARLAVLQRAVPDSAALANFIRDANEIAQASGLVWRSVTHGPPALGVANSASISVGIQMTGTYENAMAYLRQLAALKRLVVVDTVSFSAAGPTGAGVGAGAGASESTGPFSGASELSIAISARMFATPEALAAATDGTGATTAVTPPPATGNGSAVNDS
jgi:Tfp pilus assembly protein PilO